MSYNSRINAYLARKGTPGPWDVAGDPGSGDLAGAVVIPSLAESRSLFATLNSLSRNPQEILRQFLVLVVVNHREDAPSEDKEDNLLTLRLLREFRQKHPYPRLVWIDAASSGKEFAVRGGGVGLARKIGFDFALPYLASSPRPILVALDADTLVRDDYLSAILDHFRSGNKGGAVIPFCHRPPEVSSQVMAITRYELFLRSYVLGLSLASSPYAFHTVGSAMACTVEAYLKMGGMNTRAAGEDFYFLQQLYRTSGVSQVKGTVVHPSPRASHRVPFGTGRSISRQINAGEEVLFYRPECFHILKRWLHVGSCIHKNGVQQGLAAAEAISPRLYDYLERLEAEKILNRLIRHNPAPDSFIQAFHGWFDGLKTMRFIHHLSTFLPRGPAEECVPELMTGCGIDPDPAGVEGWLSQLRRLQNGCSCSVCTGRPPSISLTYAA